ncbi:dTDP-4-dehydrorhamnose 3,5-epimerase [Clostridioides difficile]
MKVLNTELIDVYILEPKVFSDNRGWFMETWSKHEMEKHGLYYDFIQDNQSYSSKKNTIRGLHFQDGEASQAKLVRCVRGSVLDVAVDLRKGSPTYKKWIAVELSEYNKKQLLIPRGFAHAFLTLTDEVEFIYRVDNCYCPDAERSIVWNDSDINVDWKVKDPILSEKDLKAPRLSSCDINFKYEVKR